MTVAFKNEAAFDKWVRDNKLEGKVKPIRRETPPPEPMPRKPARKRDWRRMRQQTAIIIYLVIMGLSCLGLYTCMVIGAAKHYVESQIEL